MSSWSRYEGRMGGMIPSSMSHIQGSQEEYDHIPRSSYGGWINTQFPVSEGQGQNSLQWDYNQQNAFGQSVTPIMYSSIKKKMNWDRVILIGLVIFELWQVFGQNERITFL